MPILTVLEITLLRGTPYEWFVVSRANGTNETATSPTWKFYNEGPGSVRITPHFLPKRLVRHEVPRLLLRGSITLEWSGSDVDNDLSDFEVFFGTDPSALASIGTTTESTLDTSIDTGTVYYWRVISQDSQGNTSQSEIFEFRVQ